MKLSEIKLPTNKKFGYLFVSIFTLISAYFFVSSKLGWAAFFAIKAIILFVITFTKADLLAPYNEYWMRFGLLLGKIISPIVLGIIFFLIFTTIAFFMRLIKRDELRLKFKNKISHWILRSKQQESFKNQF